MLYADGLYLDLVLGISTKYQHVISVKGEQLNKRDSPARKFTSFFVFFNTVNHNLIFGIFKNIPTLRTYFNIIEFL